MLFSILWAHATGNQFPRASHDPGLSPRSHLRVAVVPPDASPSNVRRPQPSPPTRSCVSAAGADWGGKAAVSLVEQHAHHAVVV